MSSYQYPPHPLEVGNIRLLRIFPNEDNAAPLECKLLNYSLQESSRRTHLYEALSYVWGDPNERLPIFVDGSQFLVTINLHAALSRLRDHFLERIIWVDAICINQGDNKEKGQQIQFMAQIYAQAMRVIVWLGEAADDSNLALEQIRVAGSRESITSESEESATTKSGEATTSGIKETIQQATLALLSRPWFQRIWVLQEVAAARQVLVVCGFTEIDGYAFCSGLASLNLSTHPELKSIVPSVTYLIRDAIYRPKYTTILGQVSLNIRPLSELIDMYHSRKATDLRDKVFALLGMSSDDPEKAGLEPNYGISWKELFQKLIIFVLGQEISVETSDHTQMAVIKSKGCILGDVLSVKQEGQNINILIRSRDMKRQVVDTIEWILQASAKSIQEHDIICILQGASKPMIIRQYKDYFVVILIAVTSLNGDNIFRNLRLPSWVECLPHYFLLVWDLDLGFLRNSHQEEYQSLVKINSRVSDYSKLAMAEFISESVKEWDSAMIFQSVGRGREAEARLQEVINGYQIAFGEKYSLLSMNGADPTPLFWAARNGYDTVVKLLLANKNIDANFKYPGSDETALIVAAQQGHRAVVKLFLETGNVRTSSQDNEGRTLLWWAAKSGHETVVKLLLETSKAEVSLQDKDGRTPLSWAAENRHEAVVKLLLEASKAEVNLQDKYSFTPLSWAAMNGHEAVVKLLLEISKAEVSLQDVDGRTPLSWAAMNGHEAVCKLLLETSKVETSLQDKDGRTPLSLAAEYGHEAVVKLLLETSKAEISLQDRYGRTPLLWAAEYGHEAVCKLLLETSKAEINLQDRYGRTPLFWAARWGHEAICKLLLEISKAEVSLQ